jgi:GNAT superfamily N-acetyltransferase
MARTVVRVAKLSDLDLLVRHRRLMWAAIADIPARELDAADRVYRRWARSRMKSGRLAAFIVDAHGEPVASGCVWLMEVQPRPAREGTKAAYLLSMFTEPAHRGEGHATRIVREAIRWSRVRGVPVILLHASPFGERVYTRLGFARTAEMRRDLRPGSHRRVHHPSRQRSRRASR